MDAESFERALSAFSRRKPFHSFLICFVDGTELPIDHPEALVIVRGGTAVHIGLNGELTPFDHRSVSQVSNVSAASV
jgi:hypothetical protein